MTNLEGKRMTQKPGANKLRSKHGDAPGLRSEINNPRSTTRRRQAILEKRDALHARNLKALAAAHVLAHQHVVAPQHVGLRLGELGAVALVRPRRQTLLLHPHQPLDLILRRLMAVRTA